jgi:hypothetical protein
MRAIRIEGAFAACSSGKRIDEELQDAARMHFKV